MPLIQRKKTSLDSTIKQAVDSNFKKYSKTYQLLEKYDRSPETAPQFEVERKALQNTLRQVST